MEESKLKLEAFIRTLKLEEEALKKSVDKMAAVEEDAKEYRWETGYEKVIFFSFTRPCWSVILCVF